MKEMKDIFEELEVEVTQYAVDRKHDAIKRNNLLIANDNLIAECLSQEVFSVETNSELNVAQFTEMHVANTTVEARCLALEAELANLRDTNNHDTQKELITHFSKLEESVEIIRDIVEEAKVVRPLDRSIVSACRYTKYSQELLEYAIGTCPQGSQQRAKQLAYIPLIRKKQANVPVPPSTGVNSCPNASRSQPKSHVKPNRILPAEGVNKLPVEDRSRTNKSYLRTSNRVDSSNRLKHTVVQIVLWYLDSGCTKHMTRDHSRVKKFIETVRFGNHHFGAIMGYGDYVIGNTVISRSCYVRDTNGVELIKGSRGFNLYTISIKDMMKSSPIYLLSKASKNKSWLWHRRLNHLNFGTINDLASKNLVRGLPRLKFEKDHLCSACQLGKSKKHTHKPKGKNTNVKVLNTLHIDLCGPMRVQTINGKKYILVIVDDYSRFTWVKFLRSKDETPKVVIKFITQIQVGLNKTVRYVCTDNGTEFVNHTMTEYYEHSDESGFTYTDISSTIEELSDIGSLRVDDHEYLMMLEDPYVEVALQAPPSPDYMLGPEEPEQAPPSPDYVPGPEHADDEIVAEDQPYAEDASPIAQSPEYVLESDFEMHPEDDHDEDPEEDPVDYLADGGDDGDDKDESSEDDEDEEDDDIDVEADEEEEEEHPAPSDSVVVAPTAADQAPSVEETEPLGDEAASTSPPSSRLPSA
nr:hypothetical protein [Tanacetum cinerariifolium]